MLPKTYERHGENAFDPKPKKHWADRVSERIETKAKRYLPIVTLGLGCIAILLLLVAVSQVIYRLATSN